MKHYCYMCNLKKKQSQNSLSFAYVYNNCNNFLVNDFATEYINYVWSKFYIFVCSTITSTK